MSPIKGNVAFGSGKECWGFTLGRMAKIYAEKFNMDPKALVKRLWGESYYDKKTKLWSDTR